MQSALLAWAFSVSSQASATWLGSSPGRVLCQCDSGADPALIDLVRSQLDRGGPEQLQRPPCPSPETNVVGICFFGAVLFGLGALAGLFVRPLWDYASRTVAAFFRGVVPIEGRLEGVPAISRPSPLTRTTPRGVGLLSNVGGDHPHLGCPRGELAGQ